MCHESVFQYRGKYYKHHGVPIGNPMGRYLAELVVRHKENQITSIYKDYWIFYKRYVDDVLIIWKQEDKTEETIQKFTDKAYGLKLELEQCNLSNIHFLDIQIKTSERKYLTVLYEKPTNRRILIPRWSTDPSRYKKTEFQFYFRRVRTHCNYTEAINKEIKTIYKTAKEHGYTKKYIWDIEDKINSVFLNNNTQQLDHSNPRISSTESTKKK